MKKLLQKTIRQLEIDFDWLLHHGEDDFYTTPEELYEGIKLTLKYVMDIHEEDIENQAHLVNELLRTKKEFNKYEDTYWTEEDQDNLNKELWIFKEMSGIDFENYLK